MAGVLIEEYRGGIVENVHLGNICGINDRGEAVYVIGDINRVTYLRSAAKPIQAIPAVKLGAEEKYLLSGEEAALFCASHRGEPFHIQALESAQKKAGIVEDQLLCSPTYPLSPEATRELVKEQKPPRRIYHNCSGKHTGMMVLCRLLGVSMENYWEPDHPAQQIILDHLALIADCSRAEIVQGVDGCGVPVYAMPLKSLANAYLRLACPELIGDAAVEKAVRRIAVLMNDYAPMIGGTRQICSTLLMDRNIIAKGGAKGVYCFGLKEERLGFALKITDGSEEEWPLIVASILEQIGYKNRETIDRLYSLAVQQVVNDNGRIVGENRAVFRLKH